MYHIVKHPVTGAEYIVPIPMAGDGNNMIHLNHPTLFNPLLYSQQTQQILNPHAASASSAASIAAPSIQAMMGIPSVQPISQPIPLTSSLGNVVAINSTRDSHESDDEETEDEEDTDDNDPPKKETANNDDSTESDDGDSAQDKDKMETISKSSKDQPSIINNNSNSNSNDKNNDNGNESEGSEGGEEEDTHTTGFTTLYMGRIIDPNSDEQDSEVNKEDIPQVAKKRMGALLQSIEKEHGKEIRNKIVNEKWRLELRERMGGKSKKSIDTIFYYPTGKKRVRTRKALIALLTEDPAKVQSATSTSSAIASGSEDSDTAKAQSSSSEVKESENDEHAKQSTNGEKSPAKVVVKSTKEQTKGKSKSLSRSGVAQARWKRLLHNLEEKGFLFDCGRSKLLSSGTIASTDKGCDKYCSETSLYPIGYCSHATFPSFVNPEESDVFICEVLEGPVFKVTAPLLPVHSKKKEETKKSQPSSKLTPPAVSADTASTTASDAGTATAAQSSTSSASAASPVPTLIYPSDQCFEFFGDSPNDVWSKVLKELFDSYSKRWDSMEVSVRLIDVYERGLLWEEGEAPTPVAATVAATAVTDATVADATNTEGAVSAVTVPSTSNTGPEKPKTRDSASKSDADTAMEESTAHINQEEELNLILEKQKSGQTLTEDEKKMLTSVKKKKMREESRHRRNWIGEDPYLVENIGDYLFGFTHPTLIATLEELPGAEGYFGSTKYAQRGERSKPKEIPTVSDSLVATGGEGAGDDKKIADEVPDTEKQDSSTVGNDDEMVVEGETSSSSQFPPAKELDKLLLKNHKSLDARMKMAVASMVRFHTKLEQKVEVANRKLQSFQDHSKKGQSTFIECAEKAPKRENKAEKKSKSASNSDSNASKKSKSSANASTTEDGTSSVPGTKEEKKEKQPVEKSEAYELYKVATRSELEQKLLNETAAEREKVLEALKFAEAFLTEDSANQTVSEEIATAIKVNVPDEFRNILWNSVHMLESWDFIATFGAALGLCSIHHQYSLREDIIKVFVAPINNNNSNSNNNANANTATDTTVADNETASTPAAVQGDDPSGEKKPPPKVPPKKKKPGTMNTSSSGDQASGAEQKKAIEPTALVELIPYSRSNYISGSFEPLVYLEELVNAIETNNTAFLVPIQIAMLRRILADITPPASTVTLISGTTHSEVSVRNRGLRRQGSVLLGDPGPIRLNRVHTSMFGAAIIDANWFETVLYLIDRILFVIREKKNQSSQEGDDLDFQSPEDTYNDHEMDIENDGDEKTNESIMMQNLEKRKRIEEMRTVALKQLEDREKRIWNNEISSLRSAGATIKRNKLEMEINGVLIDQNGLRRAVLARGGYMKVHRDQLWSDIRVELGIMFDENTNSEKEICNELENLFVILFPDLSQRFRAKGMDGTDSYKPPAKFIEADMLTVEPVLKLMMDSIFLRFDGMKQYLLKVKSHSNSATAINTPIKVEPFTKPSRPFQFHIPPSIHLAKSIGITYSIAAGPVKKKTKKKKPAIVNVANEESANADSENMLNAGESDTAGGKPKGSKQKSVEPAIILPPANELMKQYTDKEIDQYIYDLLSPDRQQTKRGTRLPKWCRDMVTLTKFRPVTHASRIYQTINTVLDEMPGYIPNSKRGNDILRIFSTTLRDSISNGVFKTYSAQKCRKLALCGFLAFLRDATSNLFIEGTSKKQKEFPMQIQISQIHTVDENTKASGEGSSSSTTTSSSSGNKDSASSVKSGTEPSSNVVESDISSSTDTFSEGSEAMSEEYSFNENESDEDSESDEVDFLQSESDEEFSLSESDGGRPSKKRVTRSHAAKSSDKSKSEKRSSRKRSRSIESEEEFDGGNNDDDDEEEDDYDDDDEYTGRAFPAPKKRTRSSTRAATSRSKTKEKEENESESASERSIKEKKQSKKKKKSKKSKKSKKHKKHKKKKSKHHHSRSESKETRQSSRLKKDGGLDIEATDDEDINVKSIVKSKSKSKEQHGTSSNKKQLETPASSSVVIASTNDAEISDVDVESDVDDEADADEIMFPNPFKYIGDISASKRVENVDPLEYLGAIIPLEEEKVDLNSLSRFVVSKFNDGQFILIHEENRKELKKSVGDVEKYIHDAISSNQQLDYPFSYAGMLAPTAVTSLYSIELESSSAISESNLEEMLQEAMKAGSYSALSPEFKVRVLHFITCLSCSSSHVRMEMDWRMHQVNTIKTHWIHHVMWADANSRNPIDETPSEFLDDLSREEYTKIMNAKAECAQVEKKIGEALKELEAKRNEVIRAVLEEAKTKAPTPDEKNAAIAVGNSITVFYQSWRLPVQDDIIKEFEKCVEKVQKGLSKHVEKLQIRGLRDKQSYYLEDLLRIYSVRPFYLGEDEHSRRYLCLTCDPDHLYIQDYEEMYLWKVSLVDSAAIQSMMEKIGLNKSSKLVQTIMHLSRLRREMGERTGAKSGLCMIREVELSTIRSHGLQINQETKTIAIQDATKFPIGKSVETLNFTLEDNYVRHGPAVGMKVAKSSESAHSSSLSSSLSESNSMEVDSSEVIYGTIVAFLAPNCRNEENENDNEGMIFSEAKEGGGGPGGENEVFEGVNNDYTGGVYGRQNLENYDEMLIDEYDDKNNWDLGPALWKVKYDDGTNDDLVSDEVLAGVRLYEKFDSQKKLVDIPAITPAIPDTAKDAAPVKSESKSSICFSIQFEEEKKAETEQSKVKESVIKSALKNEYIPFYPDSRTAYLVGEKATKYYLRKCLDFPMAVTNEHDYMVLLDTKVLLLCIGCALYDVHGLYPWKYEENKKWERSIIYATSMWGIRQSLVFLETRIYYRSRILANWFHDMYGSPSNIMHTFLRDSQIAARIGALDRAIDFEMLAYLSQNFTKQQTAGGGLD